MAYPDVKEVIVIRAASLTEEIPLEIRIRWNGFPVKMQRKGRIGFWDNERTIMRDLSERIVGVGRPHDYYRREFLPVVAGVLGIESDVRFAWSARAGCWCPCSPGFIVNGSKRLMGKDVYVRFGIES